MLMSPALSAYWPCANYIAPSPIHSKRGKKEKHMIILHAIAQKHLEAALADREAHIIGRIPLAPTGAFYWFVHCPGDLYGQYALVPEADKPGWENYWDGRRCADCRNVTIGPDFDAETDCVPARRLT